MSWNFDPIRPGPTGVLRGTRERTGMCLSPERRVGVSMEQTDPQQERAQTRNNKGSPLGGVRAGCSQSVAQVERMQAQHRIACSPSQLQPWLPSLVFFRATCGCGPGQKGQCRVDTNEGLPTQNVFRRTVSVLVPILVSFFSGVCPTAFKTMMMIETTSFGQQLGISKKNLCPWTCRHHHTRKPPGPLLGHQRGAAWQPPGRQPPGPVVVTMSAGLWRNFWEILRDPSSLASAAAAIRVVVRQRKVNEDNSARALFALHARTCVASVRSHTQATQTETTMSVQASDGDRRGVSSVGLACQPVFSVFR